jgi:hypothetical protein
MLVKLGQLHLGNASIGCINAVLVDSVNENRISYIHTT